MITGGLQRWVRGHPLAVDALLAAGFALFAAALSGWWQLALLSTMIAAPLAVRRRAPFACAVAMSAGCVLQLAVTRAFLMADVGVLAAVSAVAAHCREAWKRRVVAGLVVVGAAAGPVSWRGLLDGSYEDPATALAMTAVILLAAAVAWVLGESTRYRRTLVERLEEQNAALARERDQRAELAAQRERTGIAREMHDIVAHSLAVVVVQADGGAYTTRVELGRRGDDPALRRAAETLETVAAHAREALAETRRLVGVLRDGASAEYAPAAGLDGIDDLVAPLSATGRTVRVRRIGDLTGVPGRVGLAAYRIVQEGLTNVLKHAGPGASSDVLLAATERALTVSVVDDGVGAGAPDDGLGHGLRGMRERAAVLGGSFAAGPQPAGGYAVTAVLPLDEETR